MISGQRIKKNTGFQIILAGVGMGNPNCLTKEVEKAIEEADILLGAGRMIAAYQPKIEKKPYYTPEQIVPYLEGLSNVTGSRKDRKIVILFSGDTGFYSGCQKLYEALLGEHHRSCDRGKGSPDPAGLLPQIGWLHLQD